MFNKLTLVTDPPQTPDARGLDTSVQEVDVGLDAGLPGGYGGATYGSEDWR